MNGLNQWDGALHVGFGTGMAMAADMWTWSMDHPAVYIAASGVLVARAIARATRRRRTYRAWGTVRQYA